MNKTLTKILTPLASLRITVVLILLTVLLVFVGTTAQRDFGAFDVQRDYFYAWGVMAPVKYFLPLTKWVETAPGKVPLVGGYTIALAMLANLFAANILRFRIGWKDLLVVPALVALVWGVGTLTYTSGYYVLSAALILASLPLIGAAYWLHGKRGGVVLIHLGLILVLGGELATSALKVEQNMRIEEGSYANYGFDIHDAELAVIDKSPADHNKVVAVGAAQLKPGATLADKRLPFEVKVDAYYDNADLLGPMQKSQWPTSGPTATAGKGVSIAAVERPKFNGVGDSAADAPAAYLSLSAGGKDLGRYLVYAGFVGEQRVTVDGKPYDIALRFRRYYKPFELHLKDFRFDRLTGTEMAKNFSSQVRLVDKQAGEDREVKIWMNHPLRYQGETFYQSRFEPSETTTILQVVRNPSWLFPYIACVVGGLGMTAHFGANLLAFAGRKGKTPAGSAPQPMPSSGKGRKAEQYTLPPRGAGLAGIIAPVGAAAFCLIYLTSLMVPRDRTARDGGFDFKAASAIPVSYEGRVMPLDTLARVTLKIITGGKEDLSRVVPTDPPSGMQVLLNMLTRDDRARDVAMFKIVNSEVTGLMGLNPVDPKTGKDREFFSWAEMEPNLQKLQQQVVAVANIEPKSQTVFQRQLGELWKKVKTFDSIAELGRMYVMPPKEAGGEWRQIGAVFDEAKTTGVDDPAFMKFTEVLRHYHEGKPADFNAAVASYRAYLDTLVPQQAEKAEVEVFFNRVAPFYHLMVLYVLAFVLVLVSFLVAPVPVRRAVWAMLLITFLFHTGGLIFRMYLQGRPPVTTLYSSAIFIAWGGVLLAMGLEWFFKNGVGLLVAAVVGFISLFIAHNLAGSDGDTLRELQAVLDTNFWLATHVVMITLGYASTFVAGFLGITYIAMGVFTQRLTKNFGKDLTRMVYGILCFAMLFSFVGTVLGGIWADQSWGRFWGWDPKENGAILIVLWNALILHSRWAGLVRERGIMLLAIFGNCVTAWSYFGTNELGIGLHAYGFTEGRAFWLFVFFLSQIAIIALGGLLPVSAWRSADMLVGPSAPTSGKPSEPKDFPVTPSARKLGGATT